MSFDFHNANLREWHDRQITFFGEKIPESSQWSNSSEIVRVLSQFSGQDLNYIYLPTGGGLDVFEVGMSREDGCIELKTSENAARVVRPKLLHFESFQGFPSHSFFI